SSVAGDTRRFTPLASDLQALGQQGSVGFNYVAADLVGNQGTSAVQSVKIDRAPPTIGTVVVTDNGAAFGGYYIADAGVNVPVTVPVDDGANGSGAASATLTVNGTTVNSSSS